MNRQNLRIIDLSVPLDNDAKEPFPPKIEYETHKQGAKQAAHILGLEASDFPNSEAWAVETVTLTTHTGTHVDAPWHYSPLTALEKGQEALNSYLNEKEYDSLRASAILSKLIRQKFLNESGLLRRKVDITEKGRSLVEKYSHYLSVSKELEAK